MKCPVCGNEIKEEQLYCESCGYEIRIVPDFDPELDTNIRESMIEVVSGLVEEDADEEPEVRASGGAALRDAEDDVPWYEADERPSLLLGIFHFLKKRKKAALILLCLLIVAVGVTVVLGMRRAGRQTYRYQYDQGILAAERGDYEQAVACMRQAIHYDNQQPEARMMMAGYYEQMGELQSASEIYLDLISYDEYRAEAYERIVAIYESEERYLEICNLMERCEYEEIRTNYNQYLAGEPIFSIADGVYEDAQLLKISANTNGIIYYTLDGTMPDEADLVYTSPILLESGEYRIQAIFINEFGMMSKVHSGLFDIEAEPPNEPVITPDGGDYSVPEYISVEVPQGCTVYYTTDGTMPDDNSTPYTRDICMPLGATLYRFISYNEERVASNITQVEYHLNLEEPPYSPYQALLITTAGLTDRGILLSMQGEVAGAKGTYSYETQAAFVYQGEIYYLVSEYYTDESGSRYQSQTKYAVSVVYGSLHQTAMDADGHYTVIDF
ncbi:MAG: chitobiase/beta-hexosaminidase C-terminal domain-containing protein [bacterium]|nr:chitobiase/beta-hexosaminidase C-terminal domain-containing protein [bacterium]